MSGTVLLLGVAYVVAWGLSPLVVHGHSDLDVFFWPAAQYAAHGHVLTVYSFQTIDAYPDANGPLSLLVLTPIAAIASLAGWTDPRVAAGLVGVVAALASFLIAREAVGLVEQARGGVEWRLGAWSAYLLAPVLWIAVTGFGHLEQLIETYLLLVAARLLLDGAHVRTGIAFGLALLSRTAALACAAPLGIVAARGRGWQGVARMALSAAGIVLAGLAPFLIVDGRSVVHSLVGFRGGLPIGGGSLWVALYGNPVAVFAQHADAYVSLAAGMVLCAVLVRARPPLVTDARGVLGLLTIAAVCFPMLAKTVHSYYLLEPYVLATTWWLARPGRAVNWRMVAPALLTVAVFLAEWSVTLPLSGLGIVEGVASSAVLAAVIVAVAIDLIRGEMPSDRPARRGAVAWAVLRTRRSGAAGEGWR